MPTTTTVSINDELSRNDALDLSQDVQRMIRRARAMKPAQGYIDRSVRNIFETLGSMIPPSEEFTFETLRELAAENRALALRAIRPFTGFFYSNGLLPDSVKKDALLVFALLQAEERHSETAA